MLLLNFTTDSFHNIIQYGTADAANNLKGKFLTFFADVANNDEYFITTFYMDQTAAHGTKEIDNLVDGCLVVNDMHGSITKLNALLTNNNNVSADAKEQAKILLEICKNYQNLPTLYDQTTVAIYRDNTGIYWNPNHAVVPLIVSHCDAMFSYKASTNPGFAVAHAIAVMIGAENEKSSFSKQVIFNFCHSRALGKEFLSTYVASVAEKYRNSLLTNGNNNNNNNNSSDAKKNAYLIEIDSLEKRMQLNQGDLKSLRDLTHLIGLWTVKNTMIDVVNKINEVKNKKAFDISQKITVTDYKFFANCLMIGNPRTLLVDCIPKYYKKWDIC